MIGQRWKCGNTCSLMILIGRKLNLNARSKKTRSIETVSQRIIRCAVVRVCSEETRKPTGAEKEPKEAQAESGEKEAKGAGKEQKRKRTGRSESGRRGKEAERKGTEKKLKSEERSKWNGEPEREGREASEEKQVTAG